MSQQIKIPCILMRGGTSKGVFFHEGDLPADPELRDRVILRAFGSPDARQIDGLGGSYSVTSKCAIIGPGSRPGTDINYTFAQVGIAKPIVDYQGNCGNISSAVGPFAIDEGLVLAQEPVTQIRILNTNTDKVIEAEVPAVEGQSAVEGDCEIAGVPGTGAQIRLGFLEPAGSVTGKLLPTGQPIDLLDVPGLGEIEVSLVDAANPAVFVRARDVAMTGTELPTELDSQSDILDCLERIRSVAAAAMALVDDAERATELSPAVPKMAVVAPPAPYRDTSGSQVHADDVDLVARVMSMQRPHPAYAVTGAIATAAASAIPGTVVAEIVGSGSKPVRQVRLGHPSGTMLLEVVTTQTNGRPQLLKVVVERTARRLMDGHVYVPKLVWPGYEKS